MSEISELEDKVAQFCREREWDQFHTPKDLAIGISTEANELLDLFRFKSDSDTRHMMEDAEKRKQIEEELADTFFFVLLFAQMNQMDLSVILTDKLKKNEERYPVEKARGSNLKYTEL